jgi:RNA polymerase-binding transcription factor DksA
MDTIEEQKLAVQFRQAELEARREMGDLVENRDDQIEWTIFESQVARNQGALQRLNEGSYGKCKICGKLIEPERLKAWKFATTCIECARR